MRRTLALAAACILIAGQASAAAPCPWDRLVYESDENNRADYNEPYVPTKLRFDGSDAIVITAGVEKRYTAAGTAGTGTGISLVQDPDDPNDLLRIRFLNLSRILPNTADDAVLFNDDLYWPTCKPKP